MIAVAEISVILSSCSDAHNLFFYFAVDHKVHKPKSDEQQIKAKDFLLVVPQ